MNKEQKKIMLYAFGTLLFVLLIIITATYSNSTEKNKSENPTPKIVNTHKFKKGTHTVSIETFGSAEARYQVTLKSAISGKAIASPNLQIGHVFPPNTPLFTIQTSSLELSKKTNELQTEELYLKIEENTKTILLLKDELDTAIQINDLAKKQLKENSSSVDSQQKIYSDIEQLQKVNTLSKHEQLKEKVNLDRIENAFFSQKSIVLKTENNISALKIKIEQQELQNKQLYNKKEQKLIELKKIESDIKKSTLSVDFPSSVTEIAINKEEEVFKGTTLAHIISIDTIIVKVFIPDHYFKWLSEDPLFIKLNPSIQIDWLTPSGNVPFQGAHIISIGNHITSSTRSLPIIIERVNPTNKEGIPILKDELKPGAYCQINLNLTKIENTFLLPKKLIQPNNKIYYVKENKLQIIDNVTILHQDNETTIVRLPPEFEELEIITNILHHVKNNTPVQVIK